jgi:ligand-binding SRPBCC domain-containing protein
VNKTVRNERQKLLATWYNNASLAMIVAGFLTPFWAIIYGTGQTITDDGTRTAGFLICVAVGATLRYLAAHTLGSLEE